MTADGERDRVVVLSSSGFQRKNPVVHLVSTDISGAGVFMYCTAVESSGNICRVMALFVKLQLKNTHGVQEDINR